MERQAQRSCPKCDAPIAEGQRFCSQCGALAVPDNGQQTTAYSQQNTLASQPSTPPPPPYYEPQRGGQMQARPPQQPAVVPVPVPVPAYAQPPRKKRRGGCLTTFLVLLVLVILVAGGGYYGYTRLFHLGSGNSTTTTQTVTNGSGQSQSETVTTTTLNLQPVTYASVDISVVNVQQATDFTDDSPYDSTGVLRINLQESNNSDKSSSYFYSDMAFLTQADGSTLKPIKSQPGYGPDAGIKRTSWVDFAVPTSTHPDQLTLVLGTDTESQIKIPLKAGADLSAYQEKDSTPGNKFQYAGTNWTLTKVSRQLSYEAKQASNGQVYIVTTFTIDNTTQKDFYPFPGDFLRLQSGATANGPEGNAQFSDIPSGRTNVTASCAFMMPANSTDFTLILRPDELYGVTQQTSTQFQAPQ